MNFAANRSTRQTPDFRIRLCVILLSQIPIKNRNSAIGRLWIDSEKAVTILFVFTADNSKAFEATRDVEPDLGRQWGGEKYYTLIFGVVLGFDNSIIQVIEGSCQYFGYGV